MLRGANTLIAMAGHSKWASIKHRKKAVDAKRGALFEGYGPGGVAILVEALTDNRNRTGSEVRHMFTKHGGNLGEPGSVAWTFEKKGELVQRPTTRTPVEDNRVGALMRLIEALEEHDDVQAVHANFDVDAEVLERVAAA